MSIGDAAVSWSEPTITDNSGSVTVTSDYQSGDRFPVGDTIVSYTATDPSGNSDMFKFLVTVTVEGKIVFKHAIMITCVRSKVLALCNSLRF